MGETKFCTYHKCEHPIEAFGKDSRSKDGYRNICKEAFNTLYNSGKKSTVTSVETVEKFFKSEYPMIYKAIQIKAIREDKSFVEVLVNSIKIEDEIVNFINKLS